MNFRLMNETDKNFVLSTWLKSYYESLKAFDEYLAFNKLKGFVYPKDDIFFQGHQNKIKDKLKNAECMVCTAPDDDRQIIGWIVYEPTVIHYIYVKQVFRKYGIAKKLKSKVPTAVKYSHHTKFAKYLKQGLVYDPYTF